MADRRETKCPKCGGTLVPSRAIGYGSYPGTELGVEQLKKPAARRGPNRTILTALVCGKCGFTELYADEPHKLLEE